MDLDKAVQKLGDKIAEEADGKYKVSPAEAYKKARQPNGALRPIFYEHVGVTPTCRGCAGVAQAYSQLGANEFRISKMCEPCFDFVCTPVNDRSPAEERWMSLVQYNPPPKD